MALAQMKGMMMLSFLILIQALSGHSQVANQPLVTTSEMADQIFSTPLDSVPTSAPAATTPVTTSAPLMPPASPTASGSVVDDFLSVVLKVTPLRVQERRVINRRSRRRAQVDLVQLPAAPTSGSTSQHVLCGAEHIREQRSAPFATPVSACLMTAVAQDWRRQFCPTNDPSCRLMIGDASHGETLPGLWPHNTHRDGTCFDVWPMRKDGYGLAEVDYKDAGYSRERTAQLVELMHRWGSDRPGLGRWNQQIFFNDRNLKVNGRRLTRSIRGHDGHIHVCFRNNEANRRLCQQARFDTAICPELHPSGSPSPNPVRVAGEQEAPAAATSSGSRL